MQKYFNSVQNYAGEGIGGALIQVNLYPSLAAATIYSDQGITPIANPTTTDVLGNFSFYAANNRYQLVISGAGIATYTLNDVIIDDALTAAGGTVTTVGVTANNGLTQSVANPTTTPQITLGLGDLTPTSAVFTYGGNVASGGTVNLTGYGNRFIKITGTTTITGWTMATGQTTQVVFEGVLQLTYNATANNLPGAANITTAVDDRATLYYDGTTVYITSYNKADGTPVAGGGGSGTVTHTAGALTANAIAIGNGAADLTVLGSLGTTTTVLHGNAAGAPTFGAVSLSADVTGNLPVANLNSGTSASGTTFWRGDGTWATPAGSGDMVLSGVQTVTGAKTYNDATLLLAGSGSGAGTLHAPAAASTYSWTFPASSGTIPVLGFAQTWTATQAFAAITATTINGSSQIISTGVGPANDNTDGMKLIYTTGTGWVATGAADGISFGSGQLTAGGLPPTTLGGFTSGGNFSAAGTLASNSTGTINVTAGKAFVVTNGITLAGTDSTTQTFPSTSQTIAGLGVAQSWTKTQSGTPVALTVSANAVAVDLSLGNNFTLTLQATTSQVLSNPTNIVAGTAGNIAITQNATPSTLTYGTYWIEATSGTAGVVSTTASAQNLLSYYVFDATHIYYTLNKHGVA
jgi:hypothetical protein